MHASATPHRSVVAAAIYGLLNPIPFGLFVAALIFDVVYARTGVILWDKAAAWLIAIGLLFAVVPRLINLVQVWVTSRGLVGRTARVDFWLNLAAIVLAIFNAFVHSRDAYGVVPASVWLSAGTVLLLAAGCLLTTVRYATLVGEPIHE